MSAHRAVRIVSLAGFLALGASTAMAQVGSLRALVIDSSGAPIPGAEATISTLARIARTDSAGRFTMGSLPVGMFELLVRQFGYTPRRVTVAITGSGHDTVLVKLADQAATLDEMDVSASGLHPFFQGFEQRRARGIGTFITREQIDARHTTTASDLLRNVAGVNLVRVSGGMGIRFSSNTISRRGRELCTPLIWVDGQRAPGMEIDEIIATDIEGIELYRGVSTTPAQFASASSAPCGTVLVWTRRKG